MKAEPESKLRIFTEYIRTLEPGGPGPSAEMFQKLWKALRMAVRSELKKKGLWESPPAYLGVEGDRWEAPRGAARRDAGLDDALDELVKDCYLFIFDERLRNLKAHLRHKPNVDGMVFLNIRHFLHERQCRYDPVGYHVYKALHGALGRALARGELRLLTGDPRIRNDSLLGWAAPGPVRPAAFEGHSWAAAAGEALLPAMVDAKGSAWEGVLERLCERVVALRARGVEAFFFRDLVDPLKAVVRAWVAARLSAELAAAAGVSPAEASPEAAAAAAESYDKLVRCVESRLALLPLDPRTLGYLQKLWGYERTRADGIGPPLAGGADEGDALSQRKLAERLGIPRDRLPELKATLRQVVAECLAANRFTPPLQGGRDEH